MVTANAGAVAVPHTPLDQANFITHYQILIIMHRSFNTQFKKFFLLALFLNLSLVHSRLGFITFLLSPRALPQIVVEPPTQHSKTG